MDRCAGKRLVDGMVVQGKASGPVLREFMKKKKDEKITPRIGFTDNNRKVGRPPVCSSSNGKEKIAGTPGGFGYLRKPAKGTGRRQPSSNLDTDSVHDDSAAAEPTLPRLKTKRSIQSQNTFSGGGVMTKAGSSSRGTSTSSHQTSDLDTRVGPSVSSSSGSDRTVRGGLSRNGLRNLRCNSIMSNVLPTSSSSATKISGSKKKNSDGESSSSSKGNKSSVSVLKGMNQSSSHGNGITLSDSRRNRVVPTIRDNGVVSSSRSGRRGAVASLATFRQTPHPATPINSSSSRTFTPSNSYSRTSSSTGRLGRMMPGSPSLVNRDGLSRYNMNGIAEILLALERIEHDQELTYEQLASLETNLFLSDMIRFYDQHSDMRLDIDNMSYEELLALGDEMGTVSTALSEEALSRSLKKSIFQGTDETGAIYLNKDDDVKCSICQEEYVDGDEVGTMPCEHMYHVSCVQQWLRMKNWCPICKTSAEEEKSL
ncbi:unnamed protein product [Brassica oleracea var. botrytis]